MAKYTGKIFCVGFQKTGTTSIHRALDMLGYRVCGPAGRKPAWQALLAGQTPDQVLPDLIDSWDAFEDNPFFWPRLVSEDRSFFEWAYERYPDARFVLTVRLERDRWLRSFERLYKRQMESKREVFLQKHREIYPEDALIAGDLDVCADLYEAYNERVRSFFADKPAGQFIELCWERGDGWDELRDFLDVSGWDRLRTFGRAFPHQNRAAS